MQRAVNRCIALLFLGLWLSCLPVFAQPSVQKSAEADSLRRMIPILQQDSMRVNVLNELSRYFWRILSSYDSSLVYANEALKISERVRFRKGYADALYNIGIVCWRQDKYREALEYYSNSLKVYEELRNMSGKSNVMIAIGSLRSKQGKYDEALEYYFKSLRIKEELRDKDGIAVSLSTIGYTFSLQRRFSDALEYYFKSLKIHEELSNKISTAVLLNTIGYVYTYQSKYSEALENFKKALHIYEEFGNKDGIAEGMLNIGNVNLRLGKYGTALDYYLKSLQMYEERGDKLRISLLRNNISLVHRLQGKFEEALSYSFRALQLADSIGAKERKKEALFALTICYDSLGQHKRALDYYRQYVTLKDSLVNAESLEKTAKLKEDYEAEKRNQQIALLSKEKEVLSKDKELLTKDQALKESEISRQQAELARAEAEQDAQARSILLLRNEQHIQKLTLEQKEATLTEAHLLEERNKEALRLSTAESELQRAEIARRSIIQWVLAGSLAFVLAGSFWLGSLYRQKNAANKAILQQQALLEDQAHEIQQANIELHYQNEELSALNAEKSELMGIVSHDLKNPIGAVRTYAELIQSGMYSGDEILGAAGRIEQTSNRMLELVKNLLDVNHLESGGFQLNMVSFDITPLVEAAVYQYFTPAEAKNIVLNFSNEAENESIVTVDEQAMTQVLDNLVSNAVKYSPLEKNIFVRLKSSNETVRVEIQDEGPGISEEDMKKLFGKFARLSAQPTGGEHSTGLGLSIVKKMVEAMNGKVWCESVLGEGAAFIVEFPKANVIPA